MKLKYSFKGFALACLTSIAMALPLLVSSGAPTPAAGLQQKTRGMAVAYPWVFKKGTGTARTTVLKTSSEILRRAGYASIPGDVAKKAWKQGTSRLPSRSSLRSYAKGLDATAVLYGSVSWHTRSIWVNAGPKTISTATVDAYVYDTKKGKVVYSKRGITGRSDEKSNGYKIAAAILFTPVVTAVSGGPATPQEQRAVQIALALAYNDWLAGK